MKTVEINKAFNVRVYVALNTDGKSPAVGLVNADFTTKTFAKSSGSFASLSGTITEVANGWYDVPFTASEANTLGEIILHLVAQGIEPYDSKVAEVVRRPTRRF